MNISQWMIGNIMYLSLCWSCTTPINFQVQRLIRRMATISVTIRLIFLSISLSYLRPSSADYTNYGTGLSCLGRPNNSTSPAFKTNLNSLLSILEKEAPQNNGFYKTTTGEKSDKIYGLVQCREMFQPKTAQRASEILLMRHSLPARIATSAHCRSGGFFFTTQKQISSASWMVGL